MPVDIILLGLFLLADLVLIAYCEQRSKQRR